MSNIPIHELEKIYDDLAESIDSLAPEKRELFLVKLSLLAANHIKDASVFIELIHQAKVFEE